LDSTSLDQPPISAKGVKAGSLKGMKFGIPDQMVGDSMDESVLVAFEDAVERLRSEGVEFKRISLPTIEFGVTTYYIIAPAEASSNLARFDGIRFGARSEGKGHIGMVERTRGEGFGHEVKARIMIGTYALSSGYYDAYYQRAQQVRTVMQLEFLKALEEVDFIVSPTSPTPAFKLGELSRDPMALKLLDFCTIPANLGGLPCISLNCGFADGLPVGLQLMGAPLNDEKLLQTAYCVERALDATRSAPVP
jgi:aspartyl-tRNA(Asn)/glutamyl-tRNA(Gln) amidotransferase subunit A